MLLAQEIAGSPEWEQDAALFMNIFSLMMEYFSAALRRGIGKALVTGSGSGAPQGIVTVAPLTARSRRWQRRRDPATTIWRKSFLVESGLSSAAKISPGCLAIRFICSAAK